MKAVLLSALLIVTFGVHAADSVVNFSNDVFRLPDGSQDPWRLVRFDDRFPPSIAKMPVQNGIWRHTSFVAQLFIVGAGGVETAVPGRAEFGNAPTVQPGTWVGGNRTLPGVEPGTPILLRVKVWDSSIASFEAAAALSFGAGRSAYFSYTQPSVVVAPSDLFMTQFQGFEVYGPVPEPSTIALAGIGFLCLVFVRQK